MFDPLFAVVLLLDRRGHCILMDDVKINAAGCEKPLLMLFVFLFCFSIFDKFDTIVNSLG